MPDLLRHTDQVIARLSKALNEGFWVWNPPKSTFFGWFQNGTTDHAAPKRGPSRVGFPVLNRKKTQMGLQGGLRKSGYFLIPTLMLNLKVKIAADGTKNGILPD